ncbi:MAG: hypothetical protein A3J97_14130 [Spirochaetes bacterium RIFOXYC1_FULL_54_7]|nr:MAG: hypothetical protein A3J97_14130 [Spirochaetes bacterium RIFOXYC1_FULL_54_7]
MNQRKTFALLALLLCAAVVFAGGTKEAAPTTPTAGQASEKFLIGISQPFMGHPIRQAGTVLINAWLKDHPEVTVMVTDGQLNAAKQIADIEDMITKKVDIILVAAHQSPTLVRVLREAKDAGIPIIAFDRTLTDPSVQVGMVVNDDYAAGASAAKLLAEKLGGKGNVVSLQGPAGNTTVTLRQGGFLSKLSEYPGIKLVDDQVANFQRIQAVDVFENVLQAHPELDGVYCHNDEMALGVVKVLKDAGISNKIVVGVDGQKDALEAIMAGDLYGTVRKIVEFPAALDMALEYLKTGKTATMNYLEQIPITKDNVAQFYNPNAVF